MNITDLEDFSTGYADAEEDLLENDFDLVATLAFFRATKSLEPYEEGYYLKLKEEEERLQKVYLKHWTKTKELNQ